MLVVTRHHVPPSDAPGFLDRARAALAALAARPGYRSGRIGRATDDPSLWILVTDWEGVGVYRRALSAYDVRVAAVPLLSTAYDEPSAYEVLLHDGADAAPHQDRERTRRAADADVVGVGKASAPAVPTDLDERQHRPPRE